MSTASDRLREFHFAFDVTLDLAQRITLHDEEHAELREALSELRYAKRYGWATSRAGKGRHEAIARELADVMVIAYGTADLLGIDLDAAFEAVMDANMAKLPDCETCKGSGTLYATYRPGEGFADVKCGECDGTGKGKPVKRGGCGDPADATRLVFPASGWPDVAEHPDNVVALASSRGGGRVARRAFRHAELLASTPEMREHLDRMVL